MYIYDETKSYIIDNPDLTKGYLKDDILEIYHDEVPEIEEQGHYETIAVYPNGGVDQEYIIDVEYQKHIPAYTEKRNIYVYVKYNKYQLKLFELRNLKENDKILLSNTDYKAVKYSEGLYTDDEYEPIKKERERLRNEINFLEKQIRDIELYQKDMEA